MPLAVLAGLAILLAGPLHAQSANDIIEKNLAAMGGRAALSRLESRVATGKVTVSVQGNDLPGTIEIWFKAPNKSRSLTRLDLRALGGAELTVDQRCDGVAGFIRDSQRGDRDLSGAELLHMVNGTFPTPLLHYKEAGARIEAAGSETLAGRQAVVLVYTPKAGPAARLFFDAETWLLARAVTRIPLPSGTLVDQVSSPSDYRVVDGVKVPFVVAVETPGQVLTIRLEKVSHNVSIDEALFRKPAR